MRQDSNLEYFNFDSEILSISRLFYVIQIHIHIKILNT